MIELIDREDEMLIFNSNGVWVDTFYASSPEQASDFYYDYQDVKFQTIEEWINVYDKFREDWESKWGSEWDFGW